MLVFILEMIFSGDKVSEWEHTYEYRSGKWQRAMVSGR